MVKIRLAKIKDAEQIAKLAMKMMREHEKFDKIFEIKKDARKTLEKWLKAVIGKRDKKVFIADDNNKIIGYIKAGINKRPDIYKVEKMGFIYDIYVEEKYRRQGVAKLLMDNIFEWMKGKGIKYTSLYVANDNQIAASAWQKYGFKEFLREKYRKI